MAEREMRVTLISYPVYPEHTASIAARNCYSSVPLSDVLQREIDPEADMRRINDVMKSGHHSVIEHASYTFAIEGVSRTLLAQLTRHRIASYSVQSMRYVSFGGKEFGYIIPERIKALGEEQVKEFRRQMRIMQNFYNYWGDLLGKDGAEDARFVLPGAAATQIVMTMNAREMLHFFNLRMCCYDEKTEFLTAEGWKYGKDLTLCDKFYSIDANTGICTLQPCKNIIAEHYSGEMVRIKSQSIDLLVTPNHKNLVSYSYEKKVWMLDDADQHSNHKIILMKKNCLPIDGRSDTTIRLPDVVIERRNQYGLCKKRIVNGKNVNVKDLLQVLGFYLSDGCCVRAGRHYNVVFSKGDKSLLEKYKVLLERLTEHKATILKDRWAYKLTVHDRSLYDLFEPLGKACDKHIPEWVWGYNSDTLEYLYRGLLDGDFNSDETIYTTVSKHLADDVQRLALHLGMSASIGCVDRVGQISAGTNETGEDYKITSKRVSYNVSINKHKNEPIIKRGATNAFAVEPYNGGIYCVELPTNHTLYVRRNGKAVWSGNSRAQWEIRALAWKIYELVYPTAPAIFAHGGPSCATGPCPEGLRSCGKAAEMRARLEGVRNAAMEAVEK